jgi:hypothetical protein
MVKKIKTAKLAFRAIITASLCLFITLPSHAGVYKWLDENGQVHYGEQPGNADAEKVKIRQNETTKPRSVKKPEDGSEKKSDAETGQTTTEPEKPAISKKEKHRLCNQAKSDYAAISSRGRMREINKKGEYIYLTEQQRQQRLAAAKKKQAEYCR